MKSIDPLIQEWLTKTGATLKRDRKHIIYEFPNGQNVTLASTSVNRNNVQNAIHEIKKASGWVEPAVVEVKTEKVKRRPKVGRFEDPVRQLKADLREALVAKNAQLEQVHELLKDIGEARSDNLAVLNALEGAQAMNRGLHAKNEKLRTLISEMEAIITQNSTHLTYLNHMRAHCWFCRLKDWYKFKVLHHWRSK